ISCYALLAAFQHRWPLCVSRHRSETEIYYLDHGSYTGPDHDNVACCFAYHHNMDNGRDEAPHVPLR
ncbi:hypothetical protein HAX54_002741, partial [Datura stramonium]|nr:hypothetical protein [Datura stramonium]